MSFSSVLPACTLRQHPSTGFSQAVACLLPCPGLPWDVRRILLLKCMKERDPAVLLPTLAHGLSAQGVHFHHALCAPPESQYGFPLTSKKPTSSTPDGASPVGPASATSAGACGSAQARWMPRDKAPEGPDLSWQSHMQQVYGLGATAKRHRCAAAAFQRTTFRCRCEGGRDLVLQWKQSYKCRHCCA